ncbi:rod-binding protein [Desulfovibrio sp. OttesenSCG-928-C14]|nr:rod-binding protein [Desulfovibrio sp. OttesenSCG-928-C14]
MNSSALDPALAMQAAQNQEMLQKRLQIDALRQRLTPGPDDKAKLREACQGFESMFLQKMWDEMRKNVPKEGYLHSKQEAMYQSMFDQEFAKKMAEAGGIGLGQMLYEQLSQTLGESSRTASPGVNPRLPVVPAGASPSNMKYATGQRTEIKPVSEDGARSMPMPLYEQVKPLPGNPFAPPAATEEALPFDPDLPLEQGAAAQKDAARGGAGSGQGAAAQAEADFDFEALSQALLREELAAVQAGPGPNIPGPALSGPAGEKGAEDALSASGPAARRQENAAARSVPAQHPVPANAVNTPAQAGYNGPILSGLTPEEAQILADALRRNQEEALAGLS